MVRQQQLVRFGRQGFQFQHGLLDLLQQRQGPGGHGLVEQVDVLRMRGGRALPAVVVGQQGDEVSPLPPPRCQQGMGVQVQGAVVEGGRHAAAAAVALFGLAAQPFAAFDDVAPVVTAGIVDRHQDVTVAADGIQCLQRLLRQRRQAEHHHPFRQAARRWRAFAQCRDKPLVDCRPVGMAGAGQLSGQPAPQLGLPAFTFGQGGRTAVAGDVVVVVFPAGQPVGPVGLVLVVEVGQLVGQLVQAPRVGIGFDKTCQRREYRFVQPGRQLPVQAPAERSLVER